jgi:hypothetical protein
VVAVVRSGSQLPATTQANGADSVTFLSMLPKKFDVVFGFFA